MALARGTVLEWGKDKLHINGRYFVPHCDFGFKTASTAVHVLEEHDTWGYVYRHKATLLRASDGIMMIHPLDESIQQERAMIERIAAGLVFLSPGVQAPRKNNARTLGLPGAFYAKPEPIERFHIEEISYCAAAGQGYLRPVALLL